jgi:hypothetical protein
MRIVHVDSHRTHTVQIVCAECGARCYAPSERELIAEQNTGRISKQMYTQKQQRAWADLDAPAGTFYCTDCANDKDPKTVSGVTL